MSEKYKTHEGRLYFVTFSMIEWIDLSVRREYQDFLIEISGFVKKIKVWNYIVIASFPRTKGTLSPTGAYGGG